MVAICINCDKMKVEAGKRRIAKEGKKMKAMWVAKRMRKDIWGRVSVRYFGGKCTDPMGFTHAVLTDEGDKAVRYSTKRSAMQAVAETGLWDKEWTVERI